MIDDKILKEKKVTDIGHLIKDEGYRRNPYRDSRGYLTGGIGHKFTEEDYKNFKPEWTDRQKDAYWAERFEEDLSSASSSASDILKKKGIPEDPVVKEVVTNMVFNLGRSGVLSFDNFLTALAEKDVDSAAREMKYNGEKETPWYTQVPNRVERLAERLQMAFSDEESA